MADLDQGSLQNAHLKINKMREFRIYISSRMIA